MEKTRTYFFVIGFALILMMPVLLQKSSGYFALSGVSERAEFPSWSISGSLDGTYQEAVNTYYAENLPGRDLMIKLRNQAIFSLFAKSPNQNIVIGKDQVLFEKEYILKYEKYYQPATKEYIRDLCDKLVWLQEKLEQRGKELFIFVTPTKVRYYEEYVPDLYRNRVNFPEMEGNYEIFMDAVKEYPLKVYDSIPYINARRETAEFPLYYKTGSHWSWMISTEVTADLIRFLNANSRYQFPEADTAYYPVSEPPSPDADIFDSLNLLISPYDTYYQADLIAEPRTDKGPNLFCRGGSFMGQTIVPLIRHGYFGHDTYVENTMISHDQLSQVDYFSEYDELDLKKEINQADIVLLEVNESHIPVMGFGLIEYFVEHPDILEE